MESKDFFGAPDPEEALSAPSLLSIVVETCVSDFTAHYHALPDGNFRVSSDGTNDCILSEDEVIEDIRCWVRELQGSDAIGNRIVSLVSGNPGWGLVIARRVLKELRKYPAP